MTEKKPGAAAREAGSAAGGEAAAPRSATDRTRVLLELAEARWELRKRGTGPYAVLPGTGPHAFADRAAQRRMRADLQEAWREKHPDAPRLPDSVVRSALADLELRATRAEADPPTPDEQGGRLVDEAGIARDEPGGPVSAATQIVQLAREFFTFGVSDTGEPFALPNDGAKVVAMLRGGKTSLRALLAREYFTRTGRAAAQQALADALLVIEGIAQDADPARLYLRAAHRDGELWLDLGDQTGRAVRVTAGAWSVENAAPVLFKRTALTGPLPVPVPGGQLAELWDWLNVSEADRPLVAAELVARLFSEQPHVVMALFGEHGTGKTTALKVLVQLIDPGPVPARKPPRDADSWVTAAAGSWVVGLDNLSDVPGWLSDSLCRASTGDGDVRRRLYTDGDYAVFAFRRCIIFSAIDVGGLAPDLADRTLPVTLTQIPDEKRRDEEGFWPAWQDAHPRLLGAVLDLAAAVLARLPAIRLERKPRMADFARILAAVDAQLGTEALRRYASTAADLAADSLSGDPFAVRLQDRFADAGFTGTSAELLRALAPDDPDVRLPKDWPKDSRAVTSLMHRIAPALRKLGWTLTEGKDSHSKLLSWSFSPPARPEMACEDTRSSPQPPQSPRGAGIAVVSGNDAGPSQGERAGKTAQTCAVCGDPMRAFRPGQTTHPDCEAEQLCAFCFEPMTMTAPGQVAHPECEPAATCESCGQPLQPGRARFCIACHLAESA